MRHLKMAEAAQEQADSISLVLISRVLEIFLEISLAAVPDVSRIMDR